MNEIKDEMRSYSRSPNKRSAPNKFVTRKNYILMHALLGSSYYYARALFLLPERWVDEQFTDK